MKTWGNHCLCEWCCPNRIENMFCICARNLDDVIEPCDHDTRIIIAKRNSDVVKELERRAIKCGLHEDYDKEETYNKAIALIRGVK